MCSATASQARCASSTCTSSRSARRGRCGCFAIPARVSCSAILDLLERSHFEEDVTWAGTALGGDFNTVQAGTDEDVYKDARAWSTAPAREDRRLTHLLGRLDFLFFRLPPGWIATVTRLNEKFGSDHYPVLGRVERVSEQ